jgi:hypothetical protein
MAMNPMIAAILIELEVFRNRLISTGPAGGSGSFFSDSDIQFPGMPESGKPVNLQLHIHGFVLRNQHDTSVCVNK